MRPVPFTRPTLIAAVELFERHGHARFNQLVLRLGLEDEIASSTTLSVAKKCDILGRIVLQRAATVLDTLDGSMTLGEAVVREAAQLMKSNSTDPLQTAFERGLARDGYVISIEEYGATPLLRAALPVEIQLPEADHEVHQLLNAYHFGTTLGHLDQAIEAHTRGDWAGSNSQLRTFLESDNEEEAELWRGKAQALLNLYGVPEPGDSVPGFGSRTTVCVPPPSCGEAATTQERAGVPVR